MPVPWYGGTDRGIRGERARARDHGAERDAPAGQGAEGGTATEDLGAGRTPPVPVRAADGRSELPDLPTGAPIGVGGVPFASVRPVRGRAHRMTRGVAQATQA
ncbi:hypothetical protein ACFU5P_17860 [Streptomyces sp. NPDC057433]|uniref:hypothetical protein n=1 Tax=Streptomyces sp. NPDC057433 TaxID=3346132 RepID=UPI0036BF86DE